MSHPSIKQLRKALEELCKEWTGRVASFVHPILTEDNEECDDDSISPVKFIVYDTGLVYHIKWPYLEVKFVLTYLPKLHLLILGEHSTVFTLLSFMDGLYIDGLTKADVLSLNAPIVVSVPLNRVINKLEDSRGGKLFVVEDYPVTYSFNNVGKMNVDKSSSTLEIKYLIN